MELTFTRAGEFDLPVTGEYHCGATGPTVRCAYRLQIVCAESSLDGDGFLIEQFQVHEYFTELIDKAPTALSCERFAVAALVDLLGLIAWKNPVCVVEKATLEISPQAKPGTGRASVMASYTAPIKPIKRRGRNKIPT